MAHLTRRERSIAAKYRKYTRALEQAERFYALADRQLFALAQTLGGEHGITARISVDGKGLMLLDNFTAAETDPKREPEEMPKAWAHGAVRQFAVKKVNLFKADD